MSLFAHRPALRKYAAHLNRQQRCAWLAQRVTLTPRVWSRGYVPSRVVRAYAYVKVA
ncbi:MAG: hypothetical protein ACRYG5_09960 [Janthinobacterium lividum]